LKRLSSFLSVEIPMMLAKKFGSGNKACNSSSFTLKNPWRSCSSKRCLLEKLSEGGSTKTDLSEEEAGKYALYFVDVRKGLRGDCFYSLTYEEEHKLLIKKAGDVYIVVEKPVKKIPTAFNHFSNIFILSVSSIRLRFISALSALFLLVFSSASLYPFYMF
jgi:hypothetical protein